VSQKGIRHYFFIGSEHMNKLALILVIIGAINWGCIGIFGFDIVAFFTGGQLSVAARIIYTLVGLAGLWSISFLFRDERRERHRSPSHSRA